MDDFLHNLRSGKLKQPDQSRRQYNDPQYKNQQRRNIQDRRKKDNDSVIINENISALKDAFQNIANNQKLMAEAMENRSKAEERKAIALEKVVESVEKLLERFQEKSSHTESVSPEPSIQKNPEAEETDIPETDLKDSSRLTNKGREKVKEIISLQRKEGISYDKIARHLENEGYPTLSGKGKWRGQTIKRLFESTAA